jgi:phospholipase D1/2
VVVDAADYFRLARKAMLQAKSQIFLVGWDFDTRIILDADAKDGAPIKLGPLLSWLAKHHPQVSINILKWDLGAPKLLGRGTTILRLMRWAMTKQITFKLDGAHPMGASHHQKIVVVDDRLAFCGGIDMTASRWDTREHRDKDRGRRRPTTGRRYQPWHDASMAVDGDAARALGELSRHRWVIAGGAPLPVPDVRSDPWPAELQPAFRNVDVAIARTRGAHKENAEIREIEALFVDMIAQAKRFVYAESQFFASRVVTQAIERRLAEPGGPEFVILNPKTVEGWIYDEAMSPARAELMLHLKKIDTEGRFRLYTPVTRGGADIYVHSKITIVDDELLRVGSANLDNRSMGLDSECDLLIDAREEQNVGACAQIEALRNDLLAEHLDVSVDEVAGKFAATGSLIATIEALRGSGRSLVPFEPEQPNAIESAVAKTELLDPESAGGSGAAPARPGLLKGLPSKPRGV